MEFKRFNENEIDKCVELFINVFSKEPWNDRWPSTEKAKEYLNDIINTPGFKGYVAYKDGEIIGLCFGHVKKWWSGDEYFINEMCIDTKLQKTGIGSKLMDFTKSNLLKEKVKTITLITERNTIAERYYIKNGFKEVKENTFMFNSL
ncbi:MAG: GNAT family N-acetyltransferase [Firmicutes bacterium]|nr:GNAT family N-acetyltransferase [Bacillota bacterium]